MKISIFGMGYVGVVSAACLARDGHEVVGIDPVASKVHDIDLGRTPIHEPGLQALLVEAHRLGRVRATTSPVAGVADAEMIWICVGTPSAPDQGVQLASVETTIRQIGAELRGTRARPLIVLRSTVPPGTTARRLIPWLEEASGRVVGRDLDVAFHPEFLREGSAIDDFKNPPKIVAGEQRAGGADALFAIYQGYDAPRFRVSLEEAELVKYYDNAFHAVKVAFANEMGTLARAHGVDARKVAEIFLADDKLNVSAKYLRPGFAFGGSCLPKDLRALLRQAALLSVPTPLLEGVMNSNAKLIERLVGRVLEKKPRRAGLVGIAFKPGTDDMRESPYVTVAKRLLGEGVALKIYDPAVDTEVLVGSNKEAVRVALNHLETLLVSSAAALDDCDVILVNHASVDAKAVRAWLERGVEIIDLVGITGVDRGLAGYEGIAW